MKLIDIANSGNPVPFINIGAFNDLVIELQTVLGNNGLLDPPADGKFGEVSKWALGEAAQALNQGGKSAIDAAFASSLLDTATKPLFPIVATTDLAGKIVAHMTARNHWISRHPNCVNIVYIEGSELDGTPNGNPPNHFNDVRMILRVAPDTGTPQIVRAWEAVQWAERPRIHTFVGTSDLHIEHQMRSNRKDILQRAGEGVTIAKNLCENVEFSPMDATRTDIGFLSEVVAAARRLRAR